MYETTSLLRIVHPNTQLLGAYVQCAAQLGNLPATSCHLNVFVVIIGDFSQT